jgi:hypothetical protein
MTQRNKEIDIHVLNGERLRQLNDKLQHIIYLLTKISGHMRDNEEPVECSECHREVYCDDDSFDGEDR